MKDYSHLQEVLEEQHIGANEQELVREFLMSFSFLKRQQLMGIFLGFPEKISLFIELLKKKMEFAKNASTMTSDARAALIKEILNLEHSEIKNLIKELV